MADAEFNFQQCLLELHILPIFFASYKASFYLWSIKISSIYKGFLK